MNSLDSAGESPQSPRKKTAAKPITCSHCRSLLPLHSWPGQPQFDDEDEEEFSDWDGDSDLPGLRTVLF